jgi:hypothetical protein
MRNIFLVFGFIFSLLAHSQSNLGKVDIISTESDGKLLVSLVPDTDFSGLFSSIVFTVKSDKSNIGKFSTNPEVADYIQIFKSGEVIYNAGNYYTIFVGFGFIPLQDLEKNWIGNTQIELGYIKLDSEFDYDVINDEITSRHNGDFYISLNGIESQGEIKTFKKLESIEGGIGILPNPFGDNFQIINLNFSEVRKIEILDIAGKLVDQHLVMGDGIIDSKNLKSGFYVIRIFLDSGDVQSKIAFKSN